MFLLMSCSRSLKLASGLLLVAIPLCAVADSGFLHAIPSWQVVAYDESNVNSGCILSSASGGMPVVHDSIAATAYNGVDPWPDMPVRFECSNPSR